ncbi:MAG: MerR family transcriptional regulator [Gemmatimonadales bacterium]|nr:MerR family transcriptional regulator [Gemmatimonadales bacterium]
MPEKQYNLDDLVRATGFTKRQIRFYITRKLIPGCGASRGPNAIYPVVSLLRLRRISELKHRRLPPTGRHLSLEEIRHELEAEKWLRVPYNPAAKLASEQAHRPASKVREVISQDPAVLPPRGEHSDEAIRPLLVKFGDLLAELGSDYRLSFPEQSEQWQRLSIPDIEINVRRPKGAPARERLFNLSRALQKLLMSEAVNESDSS